jgi:spore coat protein CotF
MQSVCLTDQDRLGDMLSQEKQLIGTYSTYIPEASCPKLRQVLEDNFTDCVKDQYTVFDYMNQRGWYEVKAATQQEITDAVNKSNELKKQLMPQSKSTPASTKNRTG